MPLRKKDVSYEQLDYSQDDPDDEEAIEDEDECHSKRGEKRVKGLQNDISF